MHHDDARLRARRLITTTPGQHGAGETETEADEPSSHLPTSRIIPLSDPLVPPSLVTSLLFEFSRLLSLVPASCGLVINACCLCSPPPLARVDSGDYFIALLWALLTAHQCLKLTTGLLIRWRAYYSPLSTLIRLLALQAICWPATHFTLDIIGSLASNNPSLTHDNLTILEIALLRWSTARPDICWAVIGTTTCISRSIQIWVTSNLLLAPSTREETRKLGGRKWDWGIVTRVCILPAASLYFVMAWVAAWRREIRNC